MSRRRARALCMALALVVASLAAPASVAAGGGTIGFSMSYTNTWVWFQNAGTEDMDATLSIAGGSYTPRTGSWFLHPGEYVYLPIAGHGRATVCVSGSMPGGNVGVTVCGDINPKDWKPVHPAPNGGSTFGRAPTKI